MRKIITAAVLVLGGLVVFVFGSPYYRIFPTNWSQTYYSAITLVLLAASIVLKRNRSLSRFWPAAYALFIASACLVFLRTGILDLPRDESNPLRFIALDKLSQFLHTMPVILVLTLVAKDDLKSIFIQKGKLKQGLTFGLISFAAFAVAGMLMQPNATGSLPALLTSLPWLLLFVFANAIMEELWFRAIFLKKYEMLIGRNAAIVVTALVFGASHISATYDFPGGGIVFGLVVFGLGLVGAHAMLKDDSLIGPVLFHAGYDLMILVSILESL